MPHLQPTLSGKLLILRPLKSDDFERLYQAASDPLIWEQHPDRQRYVREVFQKYFNSGLESKGAFIIEDIASGEILGSSRFYKHDVQTNEIAIGYTFLVRKCWGGSFNKELKHLMLTHAFGIANTVIFEIGSENKRSRKAVEKIGGHLIRQFEETTADGQTRIHVVYAIHKKDFRGLART